MWKCETQNALKLVTFLNANMISSVESSMLWNTEQLLWCFIRLSSGYVCKVHRVCMIHFYKYIYIYTNTHITQIYCCSDLYPIPWNISLDKNTPKAKTSLESEALMLPDILGEGSSACSKQKLKDYQTSYQAHMATRQEMTSPAVPIMPAVRSPGGKRRPSILCG